MYPNPNRKKYIILVLGLAVVLASAMLLFGGVKSNRVVEDSLWYSSSRFSMSYPKNYKIDENPQIVTFSQVTDSSDKTPATITVYRFGSADTPDSEIENLKKPGSSEKLTNFLHEGKKIIVLTDTSQNTHHKSFYVKGGTYWWSIAFSYQANSEISEATEALVKTFIPNDKPLSPTGGESSN